jgi:hypothetical protein
MMFIAHTISGFQQSFNTCWPDAYKVTPQSHGNHPEGTQQTPTHAQKPNIDPAR